MTETPARVRTDVAEPIDAQRVGAAAVGLEVRKVRRLGLGLTAGTLAWATSIFAFTTVNEGTPERIGDLTGLAFQLGLFCLLAVQYRTRATGLSRPAVGLLKVEAVVLGLASVWSLLHGVFPASLQDATWLMVLDICWPLSMIGMMVIGIKIAFTGRWRGLLRWWPLVAESWVFVTIPSMIIFGDAASRWVGGGHLLIGYATLGVLLAARPELVIPKN
ncbi:hypothetical protein EV643_113217 [Kribbella sp. VKM Ac-2527]|uniref:Uncharacterized protein n=1 Tax=Kribbella caucasensis TaxID=2512215 RepID=A0A4R6K8M3_9ACTN|nr:hypothetical protein [Kribbella sp. VKM Ac-2527]TDO45444.1 hypothetical protein EV643_113217 [Kribbella sp. VKM Ac-2527]